jgi:hypothetical protein
VQWIRNCSTSNHPKQKACPKSTNAVPSLRSSNVLCDQWHTFGFINCTLFVIVTAIQSEHTSIEHERGCRKEIKNIVSSFCSISLSSSFLP